MKQHAVRGTISLAIAIGRAVRLARAAGSDPFAALLACLRSSSYYSHGGVLFDGKIVDLDRSTEGGFAVGRAVLEGFGSTDRIVVEFQNENLVARRNGKAVAMVPDILTFFDRETAEPVTTERLRYGQRLKLIGVSVPPPAPAAARSRTSPARPSPPIEGSSGSAPRPAGARRARRGSRPAGT